MGGSANGLEEIERSGVGLVCSRNGQCYRDDPIFAMSAILMSSERLAVRQEVAGNGKN